MTSVFDYRFISYGYTMIYYIVTMAVQEFFVYVGGTSNLQTTWYWDDWLAYVCTTCSCFDTSGGLMTAFDIGGLYLHTLHSE